MKFALAVFAFVGFVSSCAANVPARPPDAALPATFRGSSPSPESLGDVPLQQFYADPQLQTLIATALRRNTTIQQAYAAILAAQANVALVAGNAQPQAGLTVAAPYQNNFGYRSSLTPGSEFGPSASVGVSYQIDLFGKLASATAAARASLLSTVAAQDVVRSTLVSQVASTYFQLLELDTARSITTQTIVARKENVRLTKLRVDFGESSIQDLLQSQQALYETTEQLPQIDLAIAQAENGLSVLTGDYPHAIVRGLPLGRQVAMPLVPATGLPGRLLTRRPDVLQAEYNLVAADANIDVARKSLYPSLSLGANVGVSGQLVSGVNAPRALNAVVAVNDVFYGPSGLFALLPQLTQALFTGGRLQANVHLAQAQQQQLTYAYLQTLQVAAQEVSNGVAAYEQGRATREQAALYEQASVHSTSVAFERYEQGETSYLEVLNAQTREYQSQIGLEQARLNERLALVQLYLALGGGWES